MTNFARLDDATIGTCYHPSHPEPIVIAGKITSSAAKTTIEGKLVARLGDDVTSNCGHPAKIIAATGNITAEGKKVARAGDPFSGVYVGTITGSASRTGTDNGISGTASD